MLCVVYVLRREGRKLPAEVVRNRPAVGWLQLDQHPQKAYPERVARLLKSEGSDVDLVQMMVHAHVRRINRGGLLIFGQEEQTRYREPHLPQVWWCMPGPLDDTTAAS